MNKQGNELDRGDVIDGFLVLEVGSPATIPAKVLHDSIVARHPKGLPGRYILMQRNNATVGCTIFDDQRYWVGGRAR